MSTTVTNSHMTTAGSLDGEETILLVEDYEPIRRLLSLGLGSRGYRVLAAADGDEALEIAEQESGVIDLLLTDIVMPGINGRELADALSVTRPETRILFTSAYSGHTMVGRGITKAGDGFIKKPYLADDLAQKIREVLQTDLPNTRL
jgi:two-component system, cell cycle sensor histidine kinase and response regulator CckA